MPTEQGVAGIAHVIQLAIAPVFLLSGVSAMLGVLSHRLSRIIDRARLLEKRLGDAPPEGAASSSMHQELLVLARRARLVNLAIALCTICALLVCAVIISLFVGAFFSAEVSYVIGVIFIAALTSLGGGLITFLREITLATRSLRIGQYSFDPDRTEYHRRMIRESSVTIGGRTTRYLEAGSGRPVVLLHAFPLSADMWRPQLERPPSGSRLIAPDFRGFGKTAPDAAGRPASIDDFAADVVGLLDALAIDRAVIGGQSMGGYVTFAVFRLAPARFAGAVLADTRPGADTPAGRDSRSQMIALVRSRGAAAIADQMLPKLVSAKTTASRPDLVADLRRMIEATPPEAIAAALEAMMGRPDSTPDLARMSFRSLIVVGAEDPIAPPAEAEAMHRALPQSELVVFPDAGHLSNVEAPGPFSEALAAFLA